MYRAFLNLVNCMAFLNLVKKVRGRYTKCMEAILNLVKKVRVRYSYFGSRPAVCN